MKKLAKKSPTESYSSLKFHFWDNYKKATAEENEDAAKLYYILLKVCSLHLSTTQKCKIYDSGDLFTENIELHSFTEEEVEIIEKQVDETENTKLKARLADIAYLSTRKTKLRQKHEYIQVASEAYGKIPITATAWKHDGYACYSRYIDLISIQGKVKRKKLKLELKHRLLEKLTYIIDEPFYFVNGICEILLKLPEKQNCAEQIANKLKGLARHKGDREQYDEAERYYESAAQWYNIAGLKDKHNEMIINRAEILVKKSEKLAALVAMECIQKALDLYKSTHTATKQDKTISTRISELRERLDRLKMVIPSQMMSITTNVDITDKVKALRQEVLATKTLHEGLNILARCISIPSIQELQSMWKSGIYSSDLLASMPIKYYDTDFRIVGSTSGIDLGAVNDTSQQGIQAAMLKLYNDYAILCSLMIKDAIYHLRQCYCFEEDFLLHICTLSPIVPNERKELCAKGLYAGFNDDFVGALHILAPQLENIVRSFLRKDIDTFYITSEGNQAEKALGKLLEEPKAKEIFGQNWVYSLDAIFCDPKGPNLRNKIAHGLIDDNDKYSDHFIYAWWLIFSWIYKTYDIYRDAEPAEN